MEDQTKLLRERAKDEIRRGKKIDASLYETDFKVLVEELSIFQIELEHQNLELIKSQEEIQQSKDRYVDLFDNAPIGYLIVDSNGIIKDINHTACSLFENNRNEFIKCKITKIIHPDFQDVFYHYFRTLIKQKRNKTSDIKLQKSNNTSFYARIIGSSQSHLKSNEPEFRLAIIDVTIQKEMELKLLIAKEKAEENDLLKSAFLANMSHEIRTPMNGIMGFAELLKEPHLADETQLEYISIIEKSGDRMLSIINDIVDISKIEAGLMKLNIKESNINEQIDYIYTFFKPEVEAKGMKLSCIKPLSATKEIISTDKEKLYAILINLVKNAIKYSEKGTIEFGYNLKTDSVPAELEFYVRDTGIGISKDRQFAIFERFVQADITNKMARQGSGLGLYISKVYIEMLGGRVWVESEEGIGSCFYFTLPYHAETIGKTVAGNNLKSGIVFNPAKKLKILIAEDDETSEMLLFLTVKGFSKEVLLAKSGGQAVESCRDNPDIDLVLMDIQMPEMTGYEAIKQIRQFNRKVIIIVQTAYGLSGDRERAIESGCNDYIAKPIQKEKLIALIQKYFN